MGEIDLESGRGKGDGPHVLTCIHPGLNTHIRAFLGFSFWSRANLSLDSPGPNLANQKHMVQAHALWQLVNSPRQQA